MGTRPLKYTRADRRLKENKHLPPYEDNHRTIKNTKKVIVAEPFIKDFSGQVHIITTPTKSNDPK